MHAPPGARCAPRMNSSTQTKLQVGRGPVNRLPCSVTLGVPRKAVHSHTHRFTSHHGLRRDSNHRVIATVERIRFCVFRHPWPSSANNTYSTGTLRFLRLLMICSASITGTFVSFAPCST